MPAPAVTFATVGGPAPLVVAVMEGIDARFPIEAAMLPEPLVGLDILGRGANRVG